MTYLQYLLKCVVFRQSTEKSRSAFYYSHMLYMQYEVRNNTTLLFSIRLQLIVAADTLFKKDINEEQHYILT